MYRKYGKRIADVILSVIILCMMLPVMMVVAIACMLHFNGRLLFSQPRVGRNEKIFRVYKFITMRPQRSARHQTDTERLTPFGIWLRRSSLDELPQLFNVIKGDMSLIGPRPLFTHYLPYFRPEERIRHQVRPGITGLAQISGRNDLGWNDRLALDVQYVQKLSIQSDLRIFGKTIIYIFRPKHVNADPRAAMADLHIERAHEHHRTDS